VWPVTRRKQELNNDYLNREFKDVPIVLFDIAYPEQKRSQVVFDNYRAAFQMTEFLINEGHRRIAFMDLACAEGEYLQRSTRDRYEGYLDALSAWKLTARPDDRWIIDVRERMDLAFDGFMDQHMMGSDRPTALIAIEDTAALYAIHAATERGLRVPNDLRVVGFDNLRACRAVRPPFPTSDPSFRLAGEVAVDLVVREIRGQVKPPVVYMLPVPLLLTGEQRAVSYADNIGAGQHLTPSPTLFADKTQGNKEKAMHGKAVSVE
jgi:DNA-binding LacI/PurR family transcriptional regulator